MIEIAITPNRQDCLGVHGIARDLAAAGLGTLKPLEAPQVKGAFKSEIGVQLDFPKAEEDACPLFVGRLIKGVSNGPSPDWLQQRLKSIGLRPISALVDITNYLSYDRARPLHVFDADKVKGDLRVHLAKGGEKLLALDENTYTLEGGECVISDGNGVQSLAGVMGGEETGCTQETVNVFVEAALFDEVRTATTGRRLNILSDARYRFERGVDPNSTLPGMEAATRLILDLCGGEASELVIAGDVPSSDKAVTLRPERIGQLLGIDISEDEAVKILTSLGFKPETTGAAFKVAVPSWRQDVDGEADLIEEIARIHGYNSIPPVRMSRPQGLGSTALTGHQRRVRLARRVLAARGMNEAVTWSFTRSDWADLFGGVPDSLKLENPISSDLDFMRPSVLPNLLDAARRNQDRGFESLHLFEVGPQYADDSPDGQMTAASGVRAGKTHARHWQDPARPVDVFMAKADAFALLAELGLPIDNIQIETPGPGWYHPGRSATLKLGPKNELGCFGELHPRVLKQLDVGGPAVGFEIYIDRLPLKPRKKISRPALDVSDLQAVERDFAFIVDKAVANTAITSAATSNRDLKDLIADVQTFDVFEDKNLGDDKKSIAISITLQPRDKTLTDEQIDEVSEKVIKAVEKATGGKLRG